MKKILLFAALMSLAVPFGASTLQAEEKDAVEAEEKALVEGEKMISGEEIKELQVIEARLGRGVEEREVRDESAEFSVNDRVYLWLKVTGGSSDTLTVTWKHESGSYETELNIGSSPWRTWAYKTVYAPGDWAVSVVDANGKVLKEMGFTVR